MVLAPSEIAINLQMIRKPNSLIARYLGATIIILQVSAYLPRSVQGFFNNY